MHRHGNQDVPGFLDPTKTPVGGNPSAFSYSPASSKTEQSIEDDFGSLPKSHSRKPSLHIKEHERQESDSDRAARLEREKACAKANKRDEDLISMLDKAFKK